jgi:lipoprotein-anchoring transpeptidase ErfK/SrfK
VRVKTRDNTLLAFAALLLVAGCATMEDLPPALVGEPPGPTLPHPAHPSPPPVTTPLISTRDVLAAQMLLDRLNLSCNSADGMLGQQTGQALRVWQARHGLAVTGQLDEETSRRLGPFDGAFTTHVVTEDERAQLAPVPRTWEAKSRMAWLGFETVLESVAEECHAAESVIRELNPEALWPNPSAGTVLVVPNPRPFATPAAARLTISLGQKLVRACDDHGEIIAQFPCSIAKDKTKRPKGELRIVSCAANPNYTFDPALFSEDPAAANIGRKLIIPPGPNNPVGVAWISLNLPGYGIHGTPHPEDIGKTESHGCFRLANWNAEKLLRMISIGIPVRVEE